MLLKRIISYIIITRPHIIISILFTPAAVAFLVNRGIPPFYDTFWAALLAVFAIAGAHAFNDFCDQDIDSLNIRTMNRPLPKNMICPKSVLIYSLFLLLLSLISAFFINLTCVALILIGIVLIIFYSLRVKRTKIGFILPALGAFLLPLGAWATYKPKEIFSQIPLLISTLGFFIEIPPYFCHTIADIEGDKSMNAYTLPVYIGIKSTCILMLICYLISIILIIYIGRIADLGNLYFIPSIIFGILIIGYYMDIIINFKPIKIKRLFNLNMGYIVLWSILIILDVL